MAPERIIFKSLDILTINSTCEVNLERWPGNVKFGSKIFSSDTHGGASEHVRQRSPHHVLQLGVCTQSRAKPWKVPVSQKCLNLFQLTPDVPDSVGAGWHTVSASGKHNLILLLFRVLYPVLPFKHIMFLKIFYLSISYKDLLNSIYDALEPGAT